MKLNIFYNKVFIRESKCKDDIDMLNKIELYNEVKQRIKSDKFLKGWDLRIETNQTK